MPLPQAILDDIDAVARLDIVPTILDVVCETTGLGFSAVARVTETHWVACAVRDDIGFGLKPGGELQLETTICNEIRQSGDHVVFDQATTHALFRSHPTPKLYGFESYISVPIIKSGAFFGTLCAIDPRPAKVDSPHVVNMFRLFATLIASHLETMERTSSTERALVLERERAELQNQFVAVLGHDLRNPLAAIRSGISLLRVDPTPQRFSSVLPLIGRSVDRMTALIDNVLDFARGRLGSGIGVVRSIAVKLEPTVEHVIEEARTTHPGRVIHSDIRFDRLLFVDGGRIGQLLSNLLTNALTHGDPSGPVHVLAESGSWGLRIAVTNSGSRIAPATIERLFQPFARGDQHDSTSGLGLGLYIAAQIAQSHGGTLTVESNDAETTFTLTIPPDRSQH